MKIILTILGFIIYSLGALYLGGYIFLLGGVIQFIDGVKAEPINSYNIGMGIFKFVLCWLTWFVYCVSLWGWILFGGYQSLSLFESKPKIEREDDMSKNNSLKKRIKKSVSSIKSIRRKSKQK